MTVRASLLWVLVAATWMACSADVPPLPVDVELDTVYERTDRDFDRAVLFRPDDAAADLPAFTLAPLIVIENGEAGRPAPEITYTPAGTSWTYRWTDPSSGLKQGVHLTLGADGFPLAVEILEDSSGARLLFVDSSLEQRAAQAFGAPLPGRRWSVERGIDEAPGVVVGGVFEPGTTPLGPFVYLWERTHDVNVVLCRCMPPRVFDIVDSIGYALVMAPSGEPPFEALDLDSVLRLAPRP